MSSTPDTSTLSRTPLLRLGQRASRILLATAAVGAMFATGLVLQDTTPAWAAPCTGSVRDGVANGSCTTGGPPVERTFFVDPRFELVQDFVDQKCIDKNGNPSNFGITRSPFTGNLNRSCLTQRRGTAPGNAVQGVAKDLAPKPEIGADFEGDFLIGTPVKFSATNLADATTEIPNFPGVNLVVTPVSANWNFGDGTTSTDLEPTKTYENISPNAANPDNNSVTVTMNATFNATILDNNTGVTTDLGVIQGAGNLTRQIVQIWSKQTEPQI